MEQLAQKAQKLMRSRVYLVVRASSYYWFPVTQGWRVCLNFPCTDEPRLELKPGDKVLVTRWKKYVVVPSHTNTSLLLHCVIYVIVTCRLNRCGHDV